MSADASFWKKFLYSFRYRNDIEGFMSGVELRRLYGMAREMKSIVEIGSWKGRSTHALLSGCRGTVYAVDHFRGSESERETSHGEAVDGDIFAQFMKNVGMFSNLEVLKMDSEEAASKIDRVDMVFIDGDHTYPGAKRDIDVWLPKAGKIICGHDYTYPEVRRAVDERFDAVEITQSLWIYDLRRGPAPSTRPKGPSQR